MPFNKSDLIRALSLECGISRKDASHFLNILIDTIILKTDQGSTVSIPGFGTFVRQNRGKRAGRNISTGNINVIPASSTLHFRPSRKLRKYLA